MITGLLMMLFPTSSIGKRYSPAWPSICTGYGPPTGNGTPASASPSHVTLCGPEALATMRTCRLVGAAGSKFTPSWLITIV